MIHRLWRISSDGVAESNAAEFSGTKGGAGPTRRGFSRPRFRASPEGRRASLLFPAFVAGGLLGCAALIGGIEWALFGPYKPLAVALAILGGVVIVFSFFRLPCSTWPDTVSTIGNSSTGEVLRLRPQPITETSDAPASDRPQCLRVFTQEQLNSYHQEAKSQLHTSYRLTQMAAVLGFVVVGSLGVVAARADSTTSAAIVGGVAAVGAALSGYIGHTFQSTYERALMPRMTYFAEPVVAVGCPGRTGHGGDREPRQA